MPTCAIPARHLPLDATYDVIVAGGGPAGCTAATAAARAGVRTLLIESTGCLGGMGTAGLVPAWCPFTDHTQIIYRGLAERVLRECTAGVAHERPRLESGRLDWVAIDPERLKRIYDDLVTDAGATVLFNATVAGVEPAGDRLDLLLVASKAGLTAYRARVFIDCTGDADLAAWMGCPFHKGDEEGDLQPATLCFQLANVDMHAFRTLGAIKHNGFPKEDWRIFRILESGRFPAIPDSHACNNPVGPGVIGFNAGHVWQVDNTDPASVSRALIEGRRIAAAFRDACAEFFPEAFANAFLVQTGALMGIRETRRIVGDYHLTVDDFRACRDFPDEICRNCYFVDVHHKQSQVAQARSCTENGPIGAIHLPPGRSHGIPYRCLLPQGAANLLVAGRSISTDRPTQGSTRVMPVCLAMGEAAGLAAAMAVRVGGAVRAIDVQALRAGLRREGAYLP
jgi:hypothetical protein